MNDVAETPEETEIVLSPLGNDTDVDGDTLTITGASVPAAQGTVEVFDDTTIYTLSRPPDYTGPATISYSDRPTAMAGPMWPRLWSM